MSSNDNLLTKMATNLRPDSFSALAVTVFYVLHTYTFAYIHHKILTRCCRRGKRGYQPDGQDKQPKVIHDRCAVSLAVKCYLYVE